MWTRALSVPICLIVLLTVGGGYAAAEDVPTEGENVAAPDVPPVEGETEGEALDSEVEEAQSYEEPYEESMSERFYRITPLGARVLKADADRLHALARAALDRVSARNLAT